MELLSDIILNLVDEEKSLTNALLKTKLFASRIKNEKLLTWVNNELNGYSTTDSIPDYRVIICHIYGSYLNGHTLVSDQILPIAGINKKYGFRFDERKFKDSISTFEDLLKTENKRKLTIPFSSELLGTIEDYIISNDNPYFRLHSAYQYIPPTVISNIVFQTRNQLLELMLKIDSEFGNITDLNQLISKSKEIENFMASTIINNYGDGNISNTGNENKIDAKINISKSNPIELRKVLQKNGVNQTEIDELVSIIDNDNHDIQNKKFGSLTNTWYQKMIGKTLDGTWNIATGTAAGILTEVINQYLGFN